MARAPFTMDVTKMTPTQLLKYHTINAENTWIKNYNIQVMAIKGRTKKGWIEVFKFLRRDMERTQPLTPRKTGNLIGTFDYGFPPNMSKDQIGITMGYSANYAAWVHEMVGNVKWTREGSGAHWFIDAIRRNNETILGIIAAHATV